MNNNNCFAYGRRLVEVPIPNCDINDKKYEISLYTGVCNASPDLKFMADQVDTDELVVDPPYPGI